MEAPPRFELGVKVLQTRALPLGYGAISACACSYKIKDSTDIWSGKRDSNPRHSPWQGDALPLSYSRIFIRTVFSGGSYRVRTYDPLLVRQMLSQLSETSVESLYTIPYPKKKGKRFLPLFLKKFKKLKKSFLKED